MLPFDEAGSGPAVVLLHAGIADRRMFVGVLPQLAAAGLRAIALDLPGFGEAPVAHGPQTPWQDVLHTMRELALPGAVLCGVSYGAAVALRAAVFAPAAARALLLLSPPPLGVEPSSQLSAAWAAEDNALERGDVDGAVAAVVDSWVLPDASDEVRALVAEMQRNAFTVQLADPVHDDGSDPLEDHPERLGELRIPVHTAAGEHDLPDFLEGGRAIAEAVPDGRFTLIPGAGHLAPLENPQAFIDLLTEVAR